MPCFTISRKASGALCKAKSADVKGNIRCARIVMEDGARFSGSIDMGQKAKSAGKPTALPVGDSAKQAESAG